MWQVIENAIPAISRMLLGIQVNNDLAQTTVVIETDIKAQSGITRIFKGGQVPIAFGVSLTDVCPKIIGEIIGQDMPEMRNAAFICPELINDPSAGTRGRHANLTALHELVELGILIPDNSVQTIAEIALAQTSRERNRAHPSTRTATSPDHYTASAAAYMAAQALGGQSLLEAHHQVIIDEIKRIGTPEGLCQKIYDAIFALVSAQ